MRRLLLAALLLPVFAGCRVPEEPGLLVHDTGTLRIELIDPAIPADVRKTGCRFLRGGWLRGVYPHGSQRSILRIRSVHPRLPAFGFPFEFYPAPELAFGTEPGHSTRLQLGVGIVREKGEGRFETVPVELFPWRSSKESAGGVTRFTFRQNSGLHAGYAYELSVRVTLEQGADSISFELELANTGGKPIESELYAHPFFETVPGFGAGWFRLPGAPREAIAAAPGSRELVKRAETVSAGNFSPLCNAVVIRTVPPMYRAVFWRNSVDCFSLEPFWPVSLRPGERRKWVCVLTLIR